MAKTRVIKQNAKGEVQVLKVGKAKDGMDKAANSLIRDIATLHGVDQLYTDSVTHLTGECLKHFCRYGDSRPYNALIDALNPATAGRVWRFASRYLGRLAKFDGGHIVETKEATAKVVDRVKEGLGRALAEGGVFAGTKPKPKSKPRSMTQAGLEKALAKLLEKATANELDAFTALRNVIAETEGVNMESVADALERIAGQLRPVHAA